MRRVCYEVKASRADFLCEMKQHLKRRIGLRYSNEFYFVTPVGLLRSSELPIDAGLSKLEHLPGTNAQLFMASPPRWSISSQRTNFIAE
jgi:hypothetical protein